MKERLLYIDQLKGIAILLVVMGHFIQYNSLESTGNTLFSAIYSFHMPLFMFISGYVAFKTIRIDIFNKYSAFLIKKVNTLLVPFFVWPLIVDNFFFAKKPEYNFIHTLKTLVNEPSTGLWFLWYLFFLTVFYSAFLYLSNRINKKNNLVLDAFIAFLLLSVVGGFYIMQVADYIDAFIQYFAFFFTGVFISKYNNLNKLLLDTRIFSICLLAFIVLCVHFSFDDPAFHHVGPILLLKLIISLTAIASLYYIVRNIGWHPIIDKYIRLWGAYSIVIYATHFKFIYIFSDIFPLPPMHIFLLTIIDLLVSLIIIFASMFIYRIVELCPPLNYLLYGNKKVQTTSKKSESPIMFNDVTTSNYPN